MVTYMYVSSGTPCSKLAATKWSFSLLTPGPAMRAQLTWTTHSSASHWEFKYPSDCAREHHFMPKSRQQERESCDGQRCSCFTPTRAVCSWHQSCLLFHSQSDACFGTKEALNSSQTAYIASILLCRQQESSIHTITNQLQEEEGSLYLLQLGMC